MHKCDVCSKNFAYKKSLKKHMQKVHNISLKTDSKSSTNNKDAKYKCSVCPHVFVAKSSLRRHEKIKHGMIITISLRKSKLIKSKNITFEQCNLEDYPSLKELVPEDYVYKVNCLKDLKNDNIRAKFEIANCDEKMFFVWLLKLEQKSKVTYRVKSFTKSSSPKIVFNKVFRCMHNTFPKKYFKPHPKHTGCASTLRVRIKKCSETFKSIKNTTADKNVETLISLKAIVTLNHCHNHILSRHMKKYSTAKENVCIKMKYHESFENHYDIENYSNYMHSVVSNNSNSSSSEVYVSIDYCQKNNTDFVEEVIVYASESYKLIMNDNDEKMIDNDKLEPSEEFDDYILVEYVNTEKFLNNNCSNFDTVACAFSPTADEN